MHFSILRVSTNALCDCYSRIVDSFIFITNEVGLSYMVACRYGISVQLEEKFHIYARPCIILYLSCSQPPTPCIILYLSCSPTPHTIRKKIRQYNHHSSLELPHYIYIYFHTFKIQLSKVWTRLCKLCK